MKSLISVFEKIDSKLETASNKIDTALDAVFKLPQLPLKILNIVSNTVMDRIYDFFWIQHGKKIRHLGLPYSAIFPLLHDYFIKNKFRFPVFKEGVHLMRAPVGGGKSLASFVLAEYVLYNTGSASYFTSAVENPQLTEDKRWYYVMHRVIDDSKYYKDGKKVLRHNTDKYPYIHKDERHLKFNPRLNKTKEYNEIFIPEHEDELLMRHLGFKAIYKYSQHAKLDFQEMDSLTYMHELQTIKKNTVKMWLNDGKFNKIPVYIQFHTYTINTEFDGSVKRKLFKKWKLPVPYEVLERYNTHAEASRYNHLKFDY